MLPFFALGAVWGGVFDVVTLLGKIWRLKLISFILDTLMMLIFALTFFSLLIGYNGGQIRVLFLVVSVTGFVTYLCTLHRLLVHTFDKITKRFQKSIKNSAKSLKNSKKS